MADWSIRAEGLSKKFGLTLRQSMKYGLRDSMRRLAGRATEPSVLRAGEFWAVRDVSFELKRGESLGIMGVNGSGKTTLLRILNGIYAPDVGEVTLRGRIGALIAAGAGFAPMLTGRENIFVNGALLGMTSAEIRGKLDEIVAFSELEQFIDMPVKNYSSGMYVRLGFAIAAMSEPEILLIDEVLAVGDMNFQKKCYEYLHRLKRGGTSLILVSHSIGAIWSVCDTGMLLHHGAMTVKGKVEDVIRAYDEQNARSSIESAFKTQLAVDRQAGSEPDEAKPDAVPAEQQERHDEHLPAEYGHNKGGTGDVLCTRLRVLDAAGSPAAEIGFGDPFTIEADFKFISRVEIPLIRVTIDAAHYKFIVSLDSLEQGYEWAAIEAGLYRLKIRVPHQNFRPGAYTVNISVARKGMGVHLLYWFAAGRFIVRHSSEKFLYSEPHAVLHLDAKFDVEDVASEPKELPREAARAGR